MLVHKDESAALSAGSPTASSSEPRGERTGFRVQLHWRPAEGPQRISMVARAPPVLHVGPQARRSHKNPRAAQTHVQDEPQCCITKVLGRDPWDLLSPAFCLARSREVNTATSPSRSYRQEDHLICIHLSSRSLTRAPLSALAYPAIFLPSSYARHSFFRRCIHVARLVSTLMSGVYICSA